MGGVDYLVAMLCVAATLALRSRHTGSAAQALKRFSIAATIVLLGDLLYLIVLAFAAGFLAVLTADQAKETPYFTAENAVLLRRLVPWSLPALAAAIQSAIAWGFFRRLSPPISAAHSAETVSPGIRQEGPAECGGSASGPGRAVGAAAVVCLAVAIPIVTVLCCTRPDMVDKKIVFFEKGYLNWLKPEHGQYGRLSVGMYGMLPTFLESLGARTLLSPDLSEEDLQDADALVVIYPNEPWKEGQLERIGEFVRRGGSLMVMGEHTVREKDGGSRINDALAPTAMRVPFDSAMFAIGGWLHSYDALAHPTSAGIGDEANQFGVVIGASVETRWPARPLLVGRLGLGRSWRRREGRLDAGQRAL